MSENKVSYAIESKIPIPEPVKTGTLRQARGLAYKAVARKIPGDQGIRVWKVRRDWSAK